MRVLAIKKQLLLITTCLTIAIMFGCSNETNTTNSQSATEVPTQNVTDTLPDITVTTPVIYTPVETHTIYLNSNDYVFRTYEVDDYVISIPADWSISQVREQEIKLIPPQSSKGLIVIKSNPGGEGCISICHKWERNERTAIILRDCLRSIGIEDIKVEYSGRVKKASTKWIDWNWVVSFVGSLEGNTIYGDYFITDLFETSVVKSYTFLIIKPYGVNAENAEFQLLIDFIIDSFHPNV